MRKGGWRAGILVAAGWALCALPAAAHEKWIVPGDEVRRMQAGPRPPEFAKFFPWIAATLAAACVLTASAVAADRFLRRRRAGERLCRALLRLRGAVPPLVGVSTGIVLAWSGWSRSFVAPDLPLDAVLPHAAATALAWAQVVLGAALVLGAFTRAAAVALAVVYLPGAALFGLSSWLDYVDILGFAVYLALAGRGALSVDALRRVPAPAEDTGRLAVALLRLFLGLNFVLLAVNNKLANPAVSMKITADWNLNFMKRLGVAWFTDARFVLAATAVELAVGLMLVFGAALRPLAIVVFGLLVTTFLIFGTQELVGHLPILAAGVAILFMGTGGRLWYGQRDSAEEPSPVTATRL